MSAGTPPGGRSRPASTSKTRYPASSDDRIIYDNHTGALYYD